MSRKQSGGGGPGSLAIELFGPGMTALHRVGLAGLAMTLRALEEDGSAAMLRRQGDWEVTEQSVTVRWYGDGAAFFSELLRASFRLMPSGLIWLAGLGDPRDHWGSSVVLHEAMLETFLVHRSKSRKSSGERTSLNVGTDEEPAIVKFLPLERYAHQSAPFDPWKPLKIVGWWYPGGIVRHASQERATALYEEPGQALALRYAPVGSIFFQVQRRMRVPRGKNWFRPGYCLVLPDVTDLLAYANARLSQARHGIWELQVGGAAEAAVRVLAELETRRLSQRVAAAGCTVVALAEVPWSQSMTRVQRFTLRDVRPDQLMSYRFAQHAFPSPRLMRGATDPESDEPGSWWSVPQGPDFVAANIVKGRPWWYDFSGFWQRLRDAARSKDKSRVLTIEQGGLQEMVGDQRTMPDGPEARLIRACHEAWRRRLGRIAAEAEKAGITEDRLFDLFKREYERTRISFARCRNVSMLRQTIADFWARSGTQPALQEGWSELLPLMSHRWQEARDLALVALASYRGPGATDSETSAI